MRDRNFKRVGEWTGDGYGDAKRMFKECPAEFYRVLGWADAEAEAQPIQMEVAQKKAKEKDNHKDSAANSITGKRRMIKRAPVDRTSPNYDPGDDPGDALVTD